MNWPTVEPMEGPEDRPGVLVRTPSKHDGFVADLKDEVPSSARRWWSDSRGWWVDEEFREATEFLLTTHFDGYDLIEPHTGEIVSVGRSGTRTRQRGLFG